MIGRALSLLPWCAAFIFAAGIVHLVSILAAPRSDAASGFDRVAAFAPAGRVTALPPSSSPDPVVPFRDPAVTSAICRYDLKSGPVRFGMAAPAEGFAAISLHDRGGAAFYALTDQSAVDGQIELTLEAPAAAGPPPSGPAEDEAEPQRRVRVGAPSPEGFAQFDVIPRVGGPETARRALTSVRCEVERGR